MIPPYTSAELIRRSAYAMADDRHWTWGEAGKQAFYGIISVFVILILLTLLTWVAGKVVPRFEKGRDANNDTKSH